jgi:hypothetical protein
LPILAIGQKTPPGRRLIVRLCRGPHKSFFDVFVTFSQLPALFPTTQQPLSSRRPSNVLQTR